MFFLLKDDGLEHDVAQVRTGAELVLLMGAQDEMYLHTAGVDGRFLGSIPTDEARFLANGCFDFGHGLRFAVVAKGSHDGARWVKVGVIPEDGSDLEKQFTVVRDNVRVRAMHEIRRIAEGRVLPNKDFVLGNGGGSHE
jgi:hypothetical protein